MAKILLAILAFLLPISGTFAVPNDEELKLRTTPTIKTQ